MFDHLRLGLLNGETLTSVVSEGAQEAMAWQWQPKVLELVDESTLSPAMQEVEDAVSAAYTSIRKFLQHLRYINATLQAVLKFSKAIFGQLPEEALQQCRDLAKAALFTVPPNVEEAIDSVRKVAECYGQKPCE